MLTMPVARVVEGALAAWLSEHPNVPGIVVLVRDADRELNARAGFADRERTQPITTAHAFRIASNTKTFVAVSTMGLVERGAFLLDQPIAKLLPSTVQQVLARRYDLNAITIRMLLQHTSGIASHDSAGAEAAASPFLAAVRADPSHRWTPIEQIEFSIDHFPPTHEPGARMLYTDAGYVILGQLIEHVTAQPLPVAVREHCRLDRLALRDTWWESLEPAPTPQPPRAGATRRRGLGRRRLFD